MTKAAKGKEMHVSASPTQDLVCEMLASAYSGCSL